jgi:hypothetical protein
MVPASEDMAMVCSDRDRNRFDHIYPAGVRNMAGGKLTTKSCILQVGHNYLIRF